MGDFNPLGSFDPNTAIPQALIDGAKAYFAKLPTLPAGSIQRGYWHWSVGHYAQDFSDYNGSVAFVDGAFQLHIPHDPSDNAIGVNNNAPAEHTWLRNTGAFGFCTDDMAGASEHTFGSEPVTVGTLQWLCAGAAAVSAQYGLDINGQSTALPYANEPIWLTHAEAAVRGGNPAPAAWYNYGPSGTCERWDLSSFVALPDGVNVTDAMATICGNALRTFSHRIKVAAFA